MALEDTFPSIVARWREIMCESGLEKSAAVCLLTHPSVRNLIEQPTAVEWLDASGKKRRYTFDFIARLKDGRRLAVAVKPRYHAKRQRLDQQLELIASQLPRSFADGVLLITDADLSRNDVHNASLLHQARRAPDPALDAQLLSLAEGSASTTIGALVRRSGRGGDAFRSAARLIANRLLTMNRPTRISYATEVKVATRRKVA